MVIPVTVPADDDVLPRTFFHVPSAPPEEDEEHVVKGEVREDGESKRRNGKVESSFNDDDDEVVDEEEATRRRAAIYKSRMSLGMNITLAAGIVCGVVVLLTITSYAACRYRRGRCSADQTCIYKAASPGGVAGCGGDATGVSGHYAYEACETRPTTPVGCPVVEKVSFSCAGVGADMQGHQHLLLQHHHHQQQQQYKMLKKHVNEWYV